MQGGGYQHVVSLGRGCQPAHQIRRILNTSHAHVFDWLITPDQALIGFIASGLDGLFERQRLVHNADGVVVDARNQTQYFHEFPAGSDFQTQYALHAPKYAALGERWRALLASAEPTLFVRQHGWDDERSTAIAIRDALTARAPHLPFTLLYLTPHEAGDWGEPHIVNRRLRQPEPYEWTGDDDAWQTLLDEALAAPCSKRRGP